MEWELDNNKPIYIQLVEHLKLKIISGEIKIGSKLETVRALAEDAEVNPNTMICCIMILRVKICKNNDTLYISYIKKI